MTFQDDDGGYAIITSLTHEHVNLQVLQPKTQVGLLRMSLVTKGKHM
jgi:hypothetical protein